MKYWENLKDAYDNPTLALFICTLFLGGVCIYFCRCNLSRVLLRFTPTNASLVYWTNNLRCY